MKKINFGSGKDYKEGWINLDCNKNCNKNYKTDIIHNLTKFPYPIKSNSVDEIYIRGVLLYLPLKRTIKEIVRISKNKTKIIIIEPCFPCFTSIQDQNAKTFLTWNTMNYFKNIKVIKQSFIFSPNKYLHWISYIINIHPKFYIRFLFNLLPSHWIKYKLEVCK